MTSHEPQLPRKPTFWERFSNRAGPHPLAALPAPAENLNDAIRNTVTAIASTRNNLSCVKLGHHLDTLLAAQARELT